MAYLEGLMRTADNRIVQIPKDKWWIWAICQAGFSRNNPPTYMRQTMTLKQFLASQEWAVTEVNVERRQFFGDSAFGPLWKDIPPDVEIPDNLPPLKGYLNIVRWIETAEAPEAES